ncbi:hypothetical protein B0J13DRAFT_482754 [Dactylonectria estremocensis]|uniref:Uncharacterized protein n=1 Tax=Dactylonectria estremocensis TaxID=1079267 RepID=A0A9P9E211_9HYPO|nr:hypothetical protein B0J13DRAFT_482754 [Dactylonectria estremocensis]
MPPHPLATARQPAQSSITNSFGQAVFTAQHLTLLHHAKSAPLFNPDMIQLVLDIAMTWAIDGPYVLDQLLALSADHFIASLPERAPAYQGIANELQTRALMFFNLETQHQTTEDAHRTHMPRFVFSSLLSMRMLHETFTHHRASFHVFIERFLESVLLHQGVRAVLQSGFTPAHGWASAEPLFAKFEAAGLDTAKSNAECAELNKAIDASDLGPTAIAACKSAAESLQATFNMHANLPDDSNTHAATAFPIMLAPEFIDVLRKHRPEALLVMAYYGALLHRCRRSWVIGDAGQFLVHLIANHLGNFWKDPMQWPLQVIIDEVG